MRLFSKTKNQTDAQGVKQAAKSKWSFASSALPAVIILACLLIIPLVMGACGPNNICKKCSKASSGVVTAPKDSSTEGTYASFQSSSIDGEPVDEKIFADYDVTMINVWATYCGPCLDEMPDLGEINAEYKDKGFQIVGIPIDTTIDGSTIYQPTVDTAMGLIKETKANYLHILPSADLFNAGLAKVTAVPTTFFVDSTGQIIGDTYMGSKSKADWEKIINKLL